MKSTIINSEELRSSISSPLSNVQSSSSRSGNRISRPKRLYSRFLGIVLVALHLCVILCVPSSALTPIAEPTWVYVPLEDFLLDIGMSWVITDTALSHIMDNPSEFISTVPTLNDFPQVKVDEDTGTIYVVAYIDTSNLSSSGGNHNSGDFGDESLYTIGYSTTILDALAKQLVSESANSEVFVGMPLEDAVNAIDFTFKSYFRPELGEFSFNLSELFDSKILWRIPEAQRDGNWAITVRIFERYNNTNPYVTVNFYKMPFAFNDASNLFKETDYGYYVPAGINLSVTFIGYLDGNWGIDSSISWKSSSSINSYSNVPSWAWTTEPTYFYHAYTPNNSNTSVSYRVLGVCNPIEESSESILTSSDLFSDSQPEKIKEWTSQKIFSASIMNSSGVVSDVSLLPVSSTGLDGSIAPSVASEYIPITSITTSTTVSPTVPSLDISVPDWFSSLWSGNDGLWKYVVQFFNSLGSGFTLAYSAFASLPYNLKLPIYALAAISVIFGIIWRLI